MRYLRFLWNGTPVCGVEQGGQVRPVTDLFTRQPRWDVPVLPLERLRLLAPVEPTKIVVVGRNYEAHVRESGHTLPDEPMIALKPATAVIGPGDPIVYPRIAGRVDPEAELAVVIGRAARNVETSEAPAYILGYTCLNDVTARDLQRKDVQWVRGKGFDSFAPVGPWVVPDLDPMALELWCIVNGEVRQHSHTSLMRFTPQALVSFVSRVMTLLPGDIIATGTPEGIAPIHVGDTVTVRVEGIGDLTNPVQAEA